MHRQARTDREWGQWPGLPPGDHDGRGRLQALFAPSGEADTKPLDDEAGLSALRRAYVELDERERRVRELQLNVAQLLREDADDFDRRQAELDGRAAELELKSTALEASEAAVEARRRELGAVELRSAALERREEIARARETALEHRADELASLARSVTELGATLVADPEDDVEDEHVLLVAADRYVVHVASGPAPRVGATVELEDADGMCVALTRSPFPADRRRCAVVERLVPVLQPNQASSSASPKNRPITPPAASAGT